MTNDELQALLSLERSKISLKHAQDILGYFRIKRPDVYNVMYPKFKGLLDEYYAIRSALFTPKKNLGQWQILVPVGMAIASIVGGLGIWAWGHHEQTTAYTSYLDCMKKFQDQGMSPEEATYACKGGETPIGENIEKLVKWVLIGVAGIIGMSFILKKVLER